MIVWLQISAGRGPAECEWVVARLADLLGREAKAVELKMEVLERTHGSESETLRSALLALTGNGALDFARANAGTVQWIGDSPFRTNHKRKNWFVGVQMFEPPARQDFDPEDVEIRFSRASGPGGQHVNKTETAVRVVHRPTGLTAESSSERSQHRNRQLALSRLALVIQQQDQDSANAHRGVRWSSHNALERGNPVRVFRGSAFEGGSQ